MHPVVGGVHNDRVVGDPELVEFVEHRTDVLVVRHHHVGVLPLSMALAFVLGRGMGTKTHPRGVPPEKKGFLGLVRLVNEPESVTGDLGIERLHPFAGEGAGVLDRLTAVPVGARVQHPPRAESGMECWVRGVAVALRLFLRVQVVQVAEEFVEPVHSGQELVFVAEVVFSELPRAIAQRLQEPGDGGIFGLESSTGNRR